MKRSASLGLPYPGYLWILLRKSVLMWLLVALLLFVLFKTAIPSLGVPALLVWLDRRHAREQLLQWNLGASDIWLWGVPLLTAGVLDLALQLFLGWL